MNIFCAYTCLHMNILLMGESVLWSQVDKKLQARWSLFTSKCLQAATSCKYKHEKTFDLTERASFE